MLRVVVVLPTEFGSAGEFFADAAAIEAAGAYAELVGGSDDAAMVVLGAVAAVTHRIKVGFLRPEALGGGEALAMLDRISRGRAIVIAEGDPAERWTRIDLPPDRATWNGALAQAEAAGATGVIVPWDPRLIDLLRNPAGEDDRSDLLMSTG